MSSRFDRAITARTGALIAAFAEPVVYRKGLVSDGRTINAIVDRRPAEPWPGGMEGVSGPGITITVANSNATGIAAGEIDRGKDRIDVPVRAGGVAEAMAVVEIVEQNEGWVKLRVR